MTYIKLNDDMSLSVTQADTIHRGDNMSTAITFLIPQTVEGIDVKASTVFLTYIRPDGVGDIVILEPSPRLYNQTHCAYTIPVTCKMSRYPGSVCMWLQFFSGSFELPNVKKSGECTIRIMESKNIDDCLSDHQLHAIYQLQQQLQNGGGSGSSDSSNSATDDEIINMLVQEDMLAAVADSDGSILSDENGDILLW